MGNDQLNKMCDTLSDYRGGKHSHTLPPEFYISTTWLEHETEELLRREWLCLGRVEEVANPGDYFTLEVLGEPLLVVRDKGNTVRVLSNVCRHRSMQVAEGSGQARSFVCPYHAWTYQLDGELSRTPLMEGVDKKSCSLPKLHTEIWQGFVYVNLDGKAEPLAPRLGGLDEVLRNYHTDEMHHVFSIEEVWDANWKCLIENFMEGYHLSMVHPQTLGGRTPTKLCEKFKGGVGYSGYRANYPETAPYRGKCHPDLSDRERNCSTLFCVYPTQLTSQASDILVYMCLQPAGTDQVRIRWGVSLYDADLQEVEIQARIALWQLINAEDKAKLAKVQVALKSKYAVAGPLAPDDFEGTIRDFHGYLADKLSDKI